MAHILLLEPDHVLAGQYASALQAAGHDVRLAGEGQAAVQSVDVQRPDIIITELLLPGHSGIEFLYEFRSYAEWQHIPVLIHSSIPEYGLAGLDVNYQNLGIVQYLYKSETSLAKLVMEVMRAVSMPHMRRP